MGWDSSIPLSLPRGEAYCLFFLCSRSHQWPAPPGHLDAVLPAGTLPPALSGQAGLTVLADPADVAGEHQPCSGNTGAEAAKALKKHAPLTPFHMLPVTEGFISCRLGCNGKARWKSSHLPTMSPFPTHTPSWGTLNWGTEATRQTAIPEVPGLAAVNKRRSSPPANSGATFTAWQLFQPRSPATGTTQKAQKVPSSKHCHLRN